MNKLFNVTATLLAIVFVWVLVTRHNATQKEERSQESIQLEKRIAERDAKMEQVAKDIERLNANAIYEPIGSIRKTVTHGVSHPQYIKVRNTGWREYTQGVTRRYILDSQTVSEVLYVAEVRNGVWYEEWLPLAEYEAKLKFQEECFRRASESRQRQMGPNHPFIRF